MTIIERQTNIQTCMTNETAYVVLKGTTIICFKSKQDNSSTSRETLYLFWFVNKCYRALYFYINMIHRLTVTKVDSIYVC